MMAWYLAVARYTALAHALRATKGNRQQAAKLLGVQRTYLYLLLRQLSNVVQHLASQKEIPNGQTL